LICNFCSKLEKVEFIAETESLLEAIQNFNLESPPPIENLDKILISKMATGIDKVELKMIVESLPSFAPGDNLSLFISEIESFLEYVKDKLTEAQTYLVGQALKAKIKGAARNIINFENANTWPLIKKVLIGQFGEKRSEDLLVANLSQLVQLPNEPYLNFYQKCMAAYHLLLENVMLNCSAEEQNFKNEYYKKLCASTFKLGLLEPYRSYISHFEMETIQDCLTKCQIYDNLENSWTQKESLRTTGPFFHLTKKKNYTNVAEDNNSSKSGCDQLSGRMSERNPCATSIGALFKLSLTLLPRLILFKIIFSHYFIDAPLFLQYFAYVNNLLGLENMR